MPVLADLLHALLLPLRIVLRLIHRLLYSPTWRTTYPVTRTLPEPVAPAARKGTWTLRTRTGESPLGPVKHTLNGNTGRQLWTFDPAAAPAAWEADALSHFRREYEAMAEVRHHSADEPLRLQALRETGGKRRAAKPLPKGAAEAEQVDASLRHGIGFYGSLQMEDGHWPGDYGGPMFLLPGLVIACYVTETELPAEHRAEMLRYLRNHQNEDGGTGLHIEGHSTMFGTSLNYVAARLLGMAADDPHCLRARAFMHGRGGAVNNTSWAKFWLALLGVYEWRGINPLPPEMWILPYWLIVHPGRFWCHCRMVYLPMSYLYGKRAACPPTPLTEALRKELYVEPYSEIAWEEQRNNCGPADMYVQHHPLQDLLWKVVAAAEPWIPAWLRRRALSWCADMILHEDGSTRHVDIGPVNKAINMVCCWYDDPHGEAFKAHLPRIFDYLWLAEDGMKMQGYNGSQAWDTAFAVQAIAASGLGEEAEVSPILRKAHEYLDASQVREDCPEVERYYRHISNGAWPFSTQDHGWPISDCSSEGLKGVIAVEALGLPGVAALEPERLFDCVNVILSYQNTAEHWGTGGWATYENTRGPAALELLNPSECFGDIVIDYSYCELTCACITALSHFHRRHPGHRTAEISTAIKLGAQWIRDKQRPDGSWYGSWGVCFTYGAWFGVVGLASVGEREATSPHVAKALAFLRSKQLPDGGWGESYLSSSRKEYHHADASQAPPPHTRLHERTPSLTAPLGTRTRRQPRHRVHASPSFR
mmetsp:Transcript_9363/g.31096  ORF Transcript_9363/g.31096 Transcript_9363/m.31096 type:complete len:762 (-) Transcript_9363:933-3218(-)